MLTIALFAAGGGLVSARYAMSQLEPAQASAEPQPFSVERGQGMKLVARSLEQAGLVRDARATEWYARLLGLDSRIQAGEYELSAAWSTRALLEHLSSGRVRTHPVVLPEGIRASEIALRMQQAGVADAQEFLALAMDPDFARGLGIEASSLEGYLYPETYRLPRDLEAQRVVRLLVEEFERVWSEFEQLERPRGMSRHEVVTLASIVEKETAAPEERPLIAAVFLNRLDRGMRLETDPTVIYGIPDFDGNLRRIHLDDGSNPYNTYRLAGLPPGPIANPGRDALRAVIEPAETDYLYFVSRNDGTHHFSKSYREHTNAVNRYQKRPRPK